MGTPEWLMLIGMGAFTAALMTLTFMLGRARGEREAAREYVDGLETQRAALNRQRNALDAQRVHLNQQREHLDERRRTERMPDSGRARVDEQPTREFDISTFGSGPRFHHVTDQPNKRRHRRVDDETRGR